MARALVHPRLMDRLAPTFFPSRATIEANPGTRTTSGYKAPAWAPVAGLRNLPAAVSPFHFSQAGEQRRTEATIAEATHRIGLAGPYPAITSSHRVVISGPSAGVYDITKPKTDSQTGMTVLECRTASV